MEIFRLAERRQFGLAIFRTVKFRPAEDVAIATVIDALGIPERAIEDYLYRALFDIGGWAGHIQQGHWISVYWSLGGAFCWARGRLDENRLVGDAERPTRR